MINKDTKICISVAGKPGNFGATIHNECYKIFGLNYVYLPLSTINLENTIRWFRCTPNAVGCSISTPYKKEVLKYVHNNGYTDYLKNANTVFKIGNLMYYYSTDLFAIDEIYKKYVHLFNNKIICVLGNGCMTQNFNKILFPFSKKFIILNRENINNFVFKDKFDVVINATTVGMNNDFFENKEIEKLITNSECVVDCPVSLYKFTKFIEIAKNNDKQYITGVKLSILQAAKQFEFYTEVLFNDVYGVMKGIANDNRFAQ